MRRHRARASPGRESSSALTATTSVSRSPAASNCSMSHASWLPPAYSLRRIRSLARTIRWQAPSASSRPISGSTEPRNNDGEQRLRHSSKSASMAPLGRRPTWRCRASSRRALLSSIRRATANSRASSAARRAVNATRWAGVICRRRSTISPRNWSATDLIGLVYARRTFQHAAPGTSHSAPRTPHLARIQVPDRVNRRSHTRSCTTLKPTTRPCPSRRNRISPRPGAVNASW